MARKSTNPETVEPEASEATVEDQAPAGETDQEKEDRTVALRKAYNTATNRLRDKYRDEFHSLYSEEAAKAGYEWTPRPTQEERARQQMRALLEAHPELAEEFKGD